MIPGHLLVSAVAAVLVFGCQAAQPRASSASPPEPAVAPVAMVAATTQPIQGEMAHAQEPSFEIASPNQDSLEQMIRQRSQEQPRELWPQLDHQFVRLLRDETVPDDSIESLPPDDRVLLATLCDGLSQFRTVVRGGRSALLASKIQPLVEMTDRLRIRAGLALPTVAICQTVSQFGVYEPITPAQFDAGKETPFILYCEVANFASQLASNRQWETKLSYAAAVYMENDASMPVIGKKPTNIVDRCSNRRHDFFVADRITLPPSLAAGKYVLKVTIVDQQANRIAEAMVPLTIASK